MPKTFPLKKISFFSLALFILSASSFAQKKIQALNPRDVNRCYTMEKMEEAIKKDPLLPQKWKMEGEKQTKAYLQRQLLQKEAKTEAAEIIIPIVFHLVDDSAKLSGITDRDIYEQVEILNKAYGGQKADNYKRVIPPEIYNRVGRISLKFVLARRTPLGALTTGIERRADSIPNTVDIKRTSTGGLDAWDSSRYVNVWCGTLRDGINELLGISTFPFSSTEGPQGVVISIATLPYTSNKSRSYYPGYSEGATLVHEMGHYFYLWHTFGDQTGCNNDDFRIQPGWPLPNGAGPEGDDTPEEKYDENGPSFGNPSQNYSDGCAPNSFGEMYGSFMNYFDDRALFMFSDGMRKRIEGCIDMYRPGLKTSNGATPPVPVTDAFLVTVTPHGIPERREYIVNNSRLTATIRNSGTGFLNSITLHVKLDGAGAVSTTFPLILAPGKDTVLNLGTITGATGTHTLTVYTTAPNNVADMFTNNDSLQSFLFINGSTIAAPFTENFTSAAFPPLGWQIGNPNDNTTWTRSSSAGFNLAGAAMVSNYDYTGVGQMDELVSPPIDLGSADSSAVTFKVAYAVYDSVDVSTWDGLEVYVSGDGGLSYQLAYKKTGKYLRTIPEPQTSSFNPLPSTPEKWRTENINLTPFIVPGKKLLIKFRNTNANGNNLFIDDINVSAYVLLDREITPVSISNLPDILCGDLPTPSVIIASNGKVPLTSFKVNYKLDNGSLQTVTWTGLLTKGQTAEVTLSPLTGLSQGNHLFTVYTSDPNGLSDQFPENDTIRKTIYVYGKSTLPVAEGFETITFPPAGWGISNPDREITWERTTDASKTGIASMVIRNYDYTRGNIDRFVSPIISGTSVYDSLFVSFDHAYATGLFADIPDTLDVEITTDCGKSFSSVYQKWGADLQTLADPSGANGSRFTPHSNDWVNAKIDISAFKGQDFQVSFTAKSNQQNNLYIDNINLYGLTVPKRLKEQGYLIYPNPFKQQFTIRNYEVPVTFQSASIYNSFGQLVWTKNYNGNGYREEEVDMAKFASGVYIVKLKYTDKTVVEKIIKQ